MDDSFSNVQLDQGDPLSWSDELPVFRKSSTTHQTHDVVISKFVDDIWDLGQLQWKATANVNSINFRGYPAEWKTLAKRIAWCLINIEAPIDLVARQAAARTRLTKASIHSVLSDEIKPFILWLYEHAIGNLSEVGIDILTKYSDEISNKNLSRQVKARRLWGPTRLWMYAEFLPTSDRLIRPNWEECGFEDILGAANWSAENKTIPISPKTMSPLLVWAMKFVEDYSQEIISATKSKNIYKLRLREISRTGDRAVLDAHLDRFHEKYGGLPGAFFKGMKKLGIPREYLSVMYRIGKNSIDTVYKKRIQNGQKLINATPFRDNSSITVRDIPITQNIGYYQLDELKHLLTTACYIVIAYLSGMRSEECRSIQRGCCKPIDNHAGSNQYMIRAKSYKDAIDIDGNTIDGGKVREDPWYVIEPVSKAINVMELLHDEEYLFSASAVQNWTNSRAGYTISHCYLQTKLTYFIRWCNNISSRFGLSDMFIAEDPEGRVTSKRFRRTLAWFIHRLPAGRISLGIQYGHLHGLTSDGYGSRVSSGLRDVFPMEEVLARADTLAEASDRLEAGESVSGPAADKYFSGVNEFTHRFKGKSLSGRKMGELKRDPIFRIYDNGMQPLACCYDSTKAMCHPDNGRNNDKGATPNLSRCNSQCPNAARTDEHIEILRSEIEWRLVQSKSDLVPEPLRLRHLQQVEDMKVLVEKHIATKRSEKKL